MVIISKHMFYSKLPQDATCRDIFHEDFESCIKANLVMSPAHFIPGVFSFYAPIYLIKLLMDYKKIDKQYLKKFVLSYLRSECFGVGYGTLVLSTICLNYHILGRLKYEAISVVPAFIGGLPLLFEDNKNRVLNAVLWASLVVESIFKNAYYFKIMKYSPLRETILFMMTSSLLMYLLKRIKNPKKIPTTLWFYFPSFREDYYRKFNLRNYAIKFLKQFGIGFGLSNARTIANGLVKLRKDTIRKFIMSIFNKNSFKFGMLFGTYVATFEILMFLLKKYNEDDAKNAAIAGFLAGTSYYIKPTMNVLAFAIVTTVQILCKEMSFIRKDVKNYFPVLVYMICNGFLFGNRIGAAETCPKYYYNMTSIASSGLLDRVHSTLENKYLLGI